jgi:hypothetical protein
MTGRILRQMGRVTQLEGARCPQLRHCYYYTRRPEYCAFPPGEYFMTALTADRGYTIEVEIHDRPYNNIKNWDYAGLTRRSTRGRSRLRHARHQ